jgi:hypothetical protein
MGGPYAARLIRLNCLAPDIVASILNGKQPADLTANKLIADTRLPLDWRARVCLTASSPPSNDQYEPAAQMRRPYPASEPARPAGQSETAVPPKIDFET